MTKENEKNSIDLIKLFEKILKDWKILISALFLGVVIGGYVAMTSPFEFISSGSYLIKGQGGSQTGSLSSLASLAGISIDAGSGAAIIDPILYAEIIETRKFLNELGNTKFYIEEIGDSVSLYTYFSEHQESSSFAFLWAIPKVIKSLFRSDSAVESVYTNNLDYVYYTKEQTEIMEAIKERISVSVDFETSILVINVKMQNPRLAASVVHFTENYLKNYINEYSSKVENEQLSFISVRLKEAKEDYLRSQQKLASFRDMNKNIQSQMARSEEERIRYQTDLNFDIYNTLSKQFEEKRISLKENIPLFENLESIQIPNERSEPKRALILILSVFLTVFGAVLIVLLRFLYFSNTDVA